MNFVDEIICCKDIIFFLFYTLVLIIYSTYTLIPLTILINNLFFLAKYIVLLKKSIHLQLLNLMVL